MDDKDKIIAGVNAMSVYELLLHAHKCNIDLSQLNIKDEAGEVLRLRQTLQHHFCEAARNAELFGMAMVGILNSPWPSQAEMDAAISDATTLLRPVKTLA